MCAKSQINLYCIKLNLFSTSINLELLNHSQFETWCKKNYEEFKKYVLLVEISEKIKSSRLLQYSRLIIKVIREFSRTCKQSQGWQTIGKNGLIYSGLSEEQTEIILSQVMNVLRFKIFSYVKQHREEYSRMTVCSCKVIARNCQESM